MGILRHLKSTRLRYDPYKEFRPGSHFCPRLSKGDFYKLKGYDLGAFLLKPVFAYIETLQDYHQKHMNLSFGQKLLYCWWCLDGQVCNGGFSQLYFNGYESIVPSVISGLQKVGDHGMAALIIKADDLYQKKRRILSLATIQDLFDRAFHKDKLDGMEELSDEYYKINKGTLPYLEAYIRQNPNDFCVDEEGRQLDMHYSGLCKTWYENNQLKQLFTLEDGRITGELAGYYPDGSIKEKVQFDRGVPTGEKEEYYEKGGLKYRVQINRQEHLFRHEFYFENGNLQKLEHTDIDTQELKGAYKEWYEKGRLKEEGRYKNKYSREGMWIEYYADGTKKTEREYLENTVLIHNCWNEEGKQTLINGTGTWIREDKSPPTATFDEQTYKDYKQHGLQQTRWNGILKSSSEMENGLRHGYTRSFYRNGRIRTEAVYNKGVQTSSQLFPISQNPTGKITFTYKMEDEWIEKRNLTVPDRYPVCTNEEEVKKTLKVPDALFDIQNQDIRSSVCIWLDVDERGNVTNVEFQSASVLSDVNGFMKKAASMKFEPAVKEGKALASCIYIIADFEVE